MAGHAAGRGGGRGRLGVLDLYVGVVALAADLGRAGKGVVGRRRDVGVGVTGARVARDAGGGARGDRGGHERIGARVAGLAVEGRRPRRACGPCARS